MQCEICERYIEKGKRVIVEGSVIVTCDECSRYGDVLGIVTSKEVKKPAPKVEEKEEITFELEVEELVDDYPELIRKKREILGLKQEELAKMINEPASLVHRIEIGKMEPSLQIARKLQRILDLKLLERSGAIEAQTEKTKVPDELTLGDMVIVKKKRK